MSKVYENAKDYYKDSKGIACEKIREELKQCLRESDCIRKEGRSARECLTLKPASLDNECIKLNTLLYECKRSMLDTRYRFRGRRDLD